MADQETSDKKPPPASEYNPLPPFRPLVFGEALFDRFPDGNRVLGGAPFNVAWHLRGFKADPLLLSAVGEDGPGEEILHRMARWEMDTGGIQFHPHRPTGEVVATIEDGEPSYDIRPGQAYDDVKVEELPPPHLLQEGELLYHGTLALREDSSRRTLEYLRDTLSVPTLLDVNLRDPWWTRELLDWTMEGRAWVKMNEIEFGLLSAGTSTPDSDREWEEAASAFLNRHGIGHLIVTFGSRGAMAADGTSTSWQEAPPVPEVVDTVGAGDAFSAVVALGARHGWRQDRILERATAFAADLCTIQGATSEDPELYRRHQRRWNHEI